MTEKTLPVTIPAYPGGRRPLRIRLDELEAALRRIPAAGDHGLQRLRTRCGTPA